VHKCGGVPIYTDGAGWYADACRWAGAEHFAHDRPPRNLMERMVQYLKEGTEAFDDLFPVGGRRLSSRRTFERTHNWLSAFTSTQDFALENKDLGRPRSGGGRGCPRGWTGCARSSRSGRGWA
jgi:transposase-like protein